MSPSVPGLICWLWGIGGFVSKPTVNSAVPILPETTPGIRDKP